ADRRAQRYVRAVVLDEPEPRDARVEQFGRRVYHALDYLVGRQRRGERLCEPHERFQTSAPLASFLEEGGAGDGLADLVRGRLEERELIAVERASRAPDRRHHTLDG